MIKYIEKGDGVDTTALAVELLDSMFLLLQAGFQKNINAASRGEAFILQYLARRDAYVLPSEISHEMHVSPARVAQTLNSLEKKGWVTRRINEADRRKILIALTPMGRDFAEQKRRAVVETASGMLGMLGEQDAREYVRITGLLARHALSREE